MNNLTPPNQSAIYDELEKLKQSFCLETKEDKEKFYKKNDVLFAYLSANVFRLLPQIPYSKHKSIFEKLLFNLQLLTIEEQNPASFAPHFEIIDKENILQKAQNKTPFLFCCFHLGSYSLMPTLSTYQNLDFGVLLNKTLNQRKAKLFSEAHQKLCQQVKKEQKVTLTSKMQLINVEEKTGIWQALRMLKEGKSLIVYADGNTGIDGVNQKNTIEINFLGEGLQVRQGVAFLSYSCGVPIVPIITSRVEKDSPSLNRKFEFLPVIYPPNSEKKKSISKEDFGKQAMQKLYSILEQKISTDTKQIAKWEGWIFVNKLFTNLQKPSVLLQKSNANKTPIDLHQFYNFNKERFVLIEKKQNTLFDKYTYRFFPVSDLLYELINYFSTPKKLYLSNESNKNHSLTDSTLQLSQNKIPVQALKKLIAKNILIPYQEANN
mgnify:CR=1 FL=1